MWQRLEPLLSARFDVIHVELPGFGNAPAPVEHMTAADHAAYIVRMLDERAIRRAHIAGISYGGQVAANLAVQFPDRVEKLILICSTGFLPDRVLTANPLVWKIVGAFISGTVLRSRTLMCHFSKSSFYDIATRPADLCATFFNQLSRPGARKAWLTAVREISTGRDRFRQLLKSVVAPTLIVWGENDITVPPDHAADFLTAIPGSRLVAFPACAHSVPLEKPMELCQEIEKFLSS